MSSKAKTSDDNEKKKKAKSPLKSPSKSKAKSPKKGKARAKKEALFDTKSMDVVVPLSLLGETTGGECSLMVQVDPQDANLLDFEGQTGAIGRFESDASGVTLDLKGYQYHGRIHPGPTALVMSVVKTGQLKVDSITDEFVTLNQTQDVMAKLSAVIKGDMDDGYEVVEEDVNARTKVIDEALAANFNPTKKRKVSSRKKKS